MATPQFAMKNGFFVFKAEGRAFENKSFSLLAFGITWYYFYYMKTRKQQYTVRWGEGFSQSWLSLSEAMKIVRELINEYPSVTVEKI